MGTRKETLTNNQYQKTTTGPKNAYSQSDLKLLQGIYKCAHILTCQSTISNQGHYTITATR